MAEEIEGDREGGGSKQQEVGVLRKGSPTQRPSRTQDISHRACLSQTEDAESVSDFLKNLGHVEASVSMPTVALFQELLRLKTGELKLQG